MKLFAKFLAVCVISLSLVTPIFAKGIKEQRIVVLPKDETVASDYFAAGDIVTISGTVQGDAYVAGGVVIIDGTVEGDLFAAGGTVTVSGSVQHDLRVAGGTIIVRSPVLGNATMAGGNISLDTNATISGSLLAGAGTLEIAAPIGRGITAGAGNISLNNHVGGNALLGVETLTLMPNAAVDGTLSYWSDNELTSSQGATISGVMTRHQPPVEMRNRQEISAKATSGIKAAIAGFAALFILSKIVWGLILFVAGVLLFRTVPVLTEKTLKSAAKTPWNHLLLGLIIAIMAPIFAITFAITIVGLPVTFFMVMVLGLLAIVVHMYTAQFAGTKIMSAFGGTHSQAVSYLLGLVSLAILHFVPVIGPLVCAGLGLLMLGALVREKSAAFKLMREKKIV